VNADFDERTIFRAGLDFQLPPDDFSPLPHPGQPQMAIPIEGIPVPRQFKTLAIILSGMAITPMENGQMVEYWNEIDDLGLLQLYR
jgi:hypothetical protein